MPMEPTTCKKESGEPCACTSCTPETLNEGASYAAGDDQKMHFSAPEIAKMNALFGDMDLTSGEEVDEELDLTEDDLKWLSDKFGTDS